MPGFGALMVTFSNLFFFALFHHGDFTFRKSVIFGRRSIPQLMKKNKISMLMISQIAHFSPVARKCKVHLTWADMVWEWLGWRVVRLSRLL